MFITAKAIRKLRFPIGFNQMFNQYRHAKIISYIEEKYSETIGKYGLLNQDTSINVFPGIVWVIWWQGLDNAPPLVKACINSVQNNSKNYKVIVITEENVKEYTDIPEFIYEKFVEGKISFTHLSDIVRWNVLKNNGGIWMDSTIFVKGELPIEYLQYPLFTNTGFCDPEMFNISNGKWTGFMFGGKKNHVLFQYMCEMYNCYWKIEDSIIDYFLIDYFLNIAHKNNIGGFKFFIDSNKNWNPCMFDLEQYMNKASIVDEFRINMVDTNCFKLSLKRKHYLQRCGRKTIYGHIIEESEIKFL